MRAATLFSGIGAPELACPHWSWLWHAEIEPFPAAVMAHHHPTSVNLGDVLAADFLERVQAHPVDILVGGPPCQAFSVAGLRGGLADPRGNLTLRWVQIIHASRPAFALTENVPGWLNTKDNAFGCFLGALVGADDALAAPPGGSWPSAGMVAGPLQRACWRVLDAQYFGLAQRRQRVFVVSCPADGGDPSQVLFERQGVRGNSAPGRETGAGSTTGALAGTSPGGGWRLGADEAAAGQLVPIQESGKRSGASQSSSKAGDGFGRVGDPMFTLGTDSRHAVAGPLTSCGGTERKDGTGRGTPIVPVMAAGCGGSNGGGIGRGGGDPMFSLDTTGAQAVAYRTSGNCGAWSTGDHVDTLSTGTDSSPHLIGFSCKDHGADAGDIAPTLRVMGHANSHANGGGQVAVLVALQDNNKLGTNERTTIGTAHADAIEADATEVLSIMQCEIGEEAFAEWGLGVLDSFQEAEVLLADLLRCLSSEGKIRRELEFSAHDGAEQEAARAMREVWEAGRARRSPPQWQPSGQCAEQLGAYLSKLPRQAAPPATLLRDLRQAAQGARLLQYALDAMEDDGRSAWDENANSEAVQATQLRCDQPCARPMQQTRAAAQKGASYGVRRILPAEAETLQGFPTGFTDVSFKGKPAADGNRYRALGNSMAVPVLRWILSRIEAQSQSSHSRAAQK